MSDGMSEAYREAERDKAEAIFLNELINCAANSARPTERLMQKARETDEIRGGMIGTTSWEERTPELLEKLAAGDETVWMRLVLQTDRNSLLVIDDDDEEDEDTGVIDLYTKAKAVSHFADDIILYESFGSSRELSHLAAETLRSYGFSAAADKFAFVLEVIGPKQITLRPIWVRPIVHKPGEPRRTKPFVKNSE